MRPVLRLVGIVLGCYVVGVVVLYFRQCAMLYFPSHALRSSQLAPWVDGEHVIGYCLEVPNARAIWLMMHGNAGQAADRDYALHCLPQAQFTAIAGGHNDWSDDGKVQIGR